MALPAPRASQRRLSASPHGPAHALHTLIYPHTHTRKPTWTHHTLTRPCTRRQRPCTPLHTPILHPRHTRLHTLLHLCLPCTRALTHLHATHTVHMLHRTHSTHAHAPPRTATHTHTRVRAHAYKPCGCPAASFLLRAPLDAEVRVPSATCRARGRLRVCPTTPSPAPSTPQHSSWGPPAPAQEGAQRR